MIIIANFVYFSWDFCSSAPSATFFSTSITTSLCIYVRKSFRNACIYQDYELIREMNSNIPNVMIICKHLSNDICNWHLSFDNSGVFLA